MRTGVRIADTGIKGHLLSMLKCATILHAILFLYNSIIPFVHNSYLTQLSTVPGCYDITVVFSNVERKLNLLEIEQYSDSLSMSA